MKIFKKFIVFIFSMVLALFMTAPIVGSFASAVTPTDETGFRFNSAQNYEIEQLLPATPLTIETSFKVTKDELGGRQGFIFSNYTNPQQGALLTLRITANGNPLIYYSHLNSTGALVGNYHNFSTIDVATGEIVHLTIKCDPSNGWFYCYVNGELQNIGENIGILGSKFDTSLETNAVKAKIRVGNQTRQATDNVNDKFYFQGELYSLALFDTMKLTAGIQEDYNYFLDSSTPLINTNDANLLVGYDFTSAQAGQASIADVSKNGNPLVDQTKKYSWSKTSKYDPDDYDFSFMVVGDTQIVSRISAIDLGKGILKEGNTYMDMIYDYIVDSVEEKKVKHVMGVGDITEFNAKNEWEEARRVISKMDGVVPYSIVEGNHDGSTNWFANSVLTKVVDGVETTTDVEPYFYYDLANGSVGTSFGNAENMDVCNQYYSTFFNAANSVYDNQWTYSYPEGSPDNTIHFFSGNDRLEYMVVALEYGPTDDVLNWASNIIRQYPNHNVIVTTHGYMWGADRDMAYITSADGGMAGTAGPNGSSANCGDEMWNEFVSQHKNITMLICGHVDEDIITYRKDTGVNGNVVTQMLCDAQEIDITNLGQPLIQKYGDSAANRLVGMVATYYVKGDGKTIDVEWYSPIQQAYFSELGQFTFTTETVEYPRVVASVKNGHGAVTPEKQDITSASTVVTFIPDKGYTIKSVTLNGENVASQVSNNSLTITKTTGFYEVEVEYQECTYSLSLVNDSTKGTVNLSKSTSGTYAWGTEVTFTITPKGTNTVKEVKFNGSVITANSGTYSVSIEPTKNVIEVVYNEAPPTYTVGVANEEDKGTVNGSLNGAYTAGTQLTFTVTASSGYTVKEVKFNGSTVAATGGTYKVTVAATSNYIQVIYAEVEVAPTYAFVVSNDTTKGTLSGTINSEYEAGESVSFSVAAKSGYKVSAVYFNGAEITNQSNSYTVTVAAKNNLVEVVYQAVVVPATYTVEVRNDTSKGTIQGTINGAYEEGDTISFTVAVVGENTVKEVLFNGRKIDASSGTYTVTIAATNNLIEVVYQAVVAPTTYTVEVRNDTSKGTIQGTINGAYEEGDTISFTVAVVGENTVKEVLFNGRKIDASSGTYTVTVAATNNLIEVVYNEIIPVPTYTVTLENNSSKGTVQGTFDGEHEEGDEVTFSVSALDGYFVKEVRFNGRVVVANEGVYTVRIAATDNLVEVFYGANDSEFYTLTIVNAANKGTIVARGEFKELYEVGEEVSFNVTSIGANMLKEVKYNGHIITAVNGVYTITITATNNIIEVVYNESAGFGCGASLSSCATYVLAICGLAIFLKKRKAA